MDTLLVAARWAWTICEAVFEILWWRADWNRTWSPVAWWLMAFFVVLLLLLLYPIVAPS